MKVTLTDECDNSFNRLKGVMTEAPVLAYPDMTKKFILDTDASGVGIRAFFVTGL